MFSTNIIFGKSTLIVSTYLTNAVPSYIQRIQVNTSKYIRVTQSRIKYILMPFFV